MRAIITDDPFCKESKFVEGYYYKWIKWGVESHENKWMKAFEDGKYRKCLRISGTNGASFEDIECTCGTSWVYKSTTFDVLTSEQYKEFMKEEKKMEAPMTALEKEACEQAKKEFIAKLTAEKARMYAEEFASFISNEKNARTYRKRADELKALLNITPAQMKELFD